MKELVVISGKGGTGKTSLVASFAVLSSTAVLADCDVDAADLHLVLAPNVVETCEFSGGLRASIAPDLCTACGKCRQLCRFDAVCDDAGGPRIDPIACEGCGVCARFCDAGAIKMTPAVNGQWFVSETRCGPMVHARLGIAESNSGKLVSVVRDEARRIAEDRGCDLVIIDGSPGIGCPVIASIGGADLVLVVAEPTVSGVHDLQRVAELIAHFGLRGAVCVNKWDINEEIAARIQIRAEELGLIFAGRIRYDRTVTEAQIAGLSVVEYSANGVAAETRSLWRNVGALLNTAGTTRNNTK